MLGCLVETRSIHVRRSARPVRQGLPPQSHISNRGAAHLPAQVVSSSAQASGVLGHSAALGGERGGDGAANSTIQLAVCRDRRRLRRSPQGGLARRSRCRETLPRTLPRPRSRSHPPTSMAAPRTPCWIMVRLRQAVQRRGRRSCKRTDRRRFRSIGHSRTPLRKGRLWPNRRLQPKTAFLRLSPVHRTDLEGQQRVDFTRSPRRSANDCHLRTLLKGGQTCQTDPRAEIHLPVLLSASKSIRAMPRSGFFFRRRWEGVSINTTSSVGRTVPARR
jgi:hypothetical protein